MMANCYWLLGGITSRVSAEVKLGNGSESRAVNHKDYALEIKGEVVSSLPFFSVVLFSLRIRYKKAKPNPIIIKPPKITEYI